MPDAHRRCRRPQLGLVQQMFAAPVALLVLGLARVRPAVQLQVQLADPDRCVGVVLVRLAEERGRLLDLHPCRAFEVA